MDTAFKGFCHSFYRVLSSFADKSADYNLYYSITNVRIIQAFSRKIWFFICFGVPPDRDMLSVKRKVPERERVYSFRLYEKNGEYTRGLRTSGLRERFKSPVDTVFWIG